MTTVLPILETFPSPEDFYARYWAQAPFVVRGAVPVAVMESLIDADELAALSCEDGVRSRIVAGSGQGNDWSCQFGPFDEQVFRDQPETHWSLLVQNVEQFHPDTAELLKHFDFSPRWLLDDIMVSYAAPGGTVGPHMDSYHVFLVQGSGQRTWRVGYTALTAAQEVYVEGIDLKVLRDDFGGNDVTVTCGDVIYIPPRFAHDGTALEDSLTFSVGFLGPKLSDIFMGYGEYLREFDDFDAAYPATGLGTEDAGFFMSETVTQHLQQAVSAGAGTEHFGRWLVEYFAGSSSDAFADMDDVDSDITPDDMQQKLSNGWQLIKPAHVKIVIAQNANGGFDLGFGNQTLQVNADLAALLQCLASERPFGEQEMAGDGQALSLVMMLYRYQIVEFSGAETADQ